MRPRLPRRSWGPHGALPAPGHRVQLGPPGPRLTPPPLGKLLLPPGLSLRWVRDCATVSVSDRMPSSVPCPPPVFCPSVAVSPSLCLCLSECVCVCARAPVGLSACISLSPSSSSLSLNLRLVLPLCLLTPGLPSLPLAPASHRLLGLWLWLTSLRRPACLTWRGCVRVSVCLSVCLPVARLLCQEGPVLGGRRGGKWGLDRAKGRG